MRIEFLAEGAPETPLIRIYGAELGAMVALHAALMSLAESRLSSVALASLEGFAALNASLEMAAGPRNLGIRLPADGRSFRWVASRDAFDAAAQLVEQLMSSPGHGFQWLLGGEGAMLWQQAGKVGLVVSLSERGDW